jgi:hypothetical protein
MTSEEHIEMAPMMAVSDLHARRLERWRQTPLRRIGGPDDAAAFIAALGLVTLYPASPELPNLYHAYVGDPSARTDSKWDSPSGQVFGWRWTLGRKEVAFYTALVRRRSTWIRWDLLPAALRLFGELRVPDELYDAHVISADAYRIAHVLEEAPEPLSTGELRAAAGFGGSKERRVAYLKAVEELETHLLLAKVLTPQHDDMSHVLVSSRFRAHCDAADRLPRADALDTLLGAYLPHAVYAIPTVLARHLKLAEEELRAGFERLCARGDAQACSLAGVKGDCYVWRGAEPAAAS